MKSPAVLLLALTLAAAGCSGSSNSSNQADNSAAAPAAATAAPAATDAAAGAPSAAPQSSGDTLAIDLPIYPGATKNAMLGDMNSVKCGHKETVVTYTVNADPKTVENWYASRMNGGIRIDSGKAFGAGQTMSSIEIVNPDGTSAVGITQAHLGAGVHMPGVTGNPTFIGIGKYDPALSSEELGTMEALFGPDPAAKKAAIAKMRAKCGPNSVPANM